MILFIDAKKKKIMIKKFLENKKGELAQIKDNKT